MQYIVTALGEFKSIQGLGIQLKETFIDKLTTCVIPVNRTNPTTTTRVNPTTVTPNPSSNPPINSGNNSIRTAGCRGRSVVVGEGCVDLIYIADCSKSVGAVNFNLSLDFVGRSASLFNITGGEARVTLITYDDNVHLQIPLNKNLTLNETLERINKTKFCGGATATRKVLKFVREEVMPLSRNNCKRALFLFSDGINNWAGDPLEEARALKQEKGVDIYTIAFGVNKEIRVDKPALEKLASKPEYYFAVRSASEIKLALDSTFNLSIDYCHDCGLTAASTCRHREHGVCFSEKGSWPWVAAIYKKTSNNQVFHCGGALISDCFILTAAHCVSGIKPDNLTVVLGDTERHVKEYSEIIFAVDKIHIHNSYKHNSGSLNYDIALLQLKCNVSCSPYVRKVCLPTREDFGYYRAGTKCIVAGWGATEKRTLDEKRTHKTTSLKELHLPIADKAACLDSTSDDLKHDITNYTVCAGDGTGNNDACDGDSGGPLFCKRKNDKEIGPDSYVIVGIVSWGEGCGQAGKYGVFTHLFNLMDWVRRVLDINKCKQSFNEEEKEQCLNPAVSLV
ncbi:complement factor B-like [Corticium candelabrum]|uniref:complement factor B-like n=1 Tax=Corticium candelabrum TaxID=121492 RepID=UPI002E2690A8|nr:complement factor B-like [Corticium candelabrum]